MVKKLVEKDKWSSKCICQIMDADDKAKRQKKVNKRKGNLLVRRRIPR